MVAQQHRIEESVDTEDLTRQVKAQDARITQLRTELTEQASRRGERGERRESKGQQQAPPTASSCSSTCYSFLWWSDVSD
jgi:hypothetical protein